MVGDVDLGDFGIKTIDKVFGISELCEKEV